MTKATGSSELVEQLRKMARCVYIAVEASVADDLSDGLTKAADRIADLEARLARAEAPAPRPDNALADEAVEQVLAHVAGGGPHEWGYRDPVTGEFIADDWPFRAADALAALRSTAPEADLRAENEALDSAREAFLNMLADARDFYWEPDGDETGDHTTAVIVTHWRQFSELAEALGIKAPGYMQSWEDTIDAALAKGADHD